MLVSINLQVFGLFNLNIGTKFQPIFFFFLQLPDLKVLRTKLSNFVLVFRGDKQTNLDLKLINMVRIFALSMVVKITSMCRNYTCFLKIQGKMIYLVYYLIFLSFKKFIFDYLFFKINLKLFLHSFKVNTINKIKILTVKNPQN